MGFRSTDRDLEQDTSILEESSSLGDNFGAAVGLVIDEESSYSSFLGNQGFRDRNDQVKSLVENGTIPKDIVDMYTTRGFGTSIDYGSIAGHLNKSTDYKGVAFKTDIELTKERNDDLAIRRKYRDEIFRRADGYGTAAQFAGMGAAAMLDPVNIATAVLTPATAGVKGASRALYSLSQFKRGALYGAVGAAAVEPFIHSWKEEIGAKYTIQDSMFNIAASGILNGTIDSVAGAIAWKARSMDDIAREFVKDSNEFDGDLKNVKHKNERKETKETKQKAEETKVDAKAKVDAGELDIEDTVDGVEVDTGDADMIDMFSSKDDVVLEPMSIYDAHLVAVELRNKGMDKQEAEDLAQVMYESSNNPEPKKPAKEAVEELETTQERMEVGQAKVDEEPTLNIEEVEEIDAAYQAIENSDMTDYYDDLMNEAADEIDELTMQLGCLNNGY